MPRVERTRVSIGVDLEGAHVWIDGKRQLSFFHEDGGSVSLANQILASYLEGKVNAHPKT